MRDGIHPCPGLLTKMSQVVIDHINTDNLPLREYSPFSNELDLVQNQTRRELLRNYTLDATFTLLGSVVEQTRSIDQLLSIPGTSVSAYILLRSTLEHSHKITYVSDPHINPKERICRVLRLRYAELLDVKKFWGEDQSNVEQELFARQLEPVEKWYQEITHKKPSRVSAHEVFTAVWQSGPPYGEDTRKSKVYESFYRTASAVTHGNTAAIKMYCLDTAPRNGGVVSSWRLKANQISEILLLAAGSLKYSLGFVHQLCFGSVPAGTMNKLERLESQMRQALPNNGEPEYANN